MFELVSPFKPQGDQPRAIEQLVCSISSGNRAQVLLGITGSGKTFTMANVIEKLQRPVLVMAHNKTLAAQLYQEFKSFFPHNAVEYFVSYYDYYQPEAYIARTDTYIEKDMAINDRIDKMRLSATRSLLERRDVIIVASVSCIYGLGSPEYYKGMTLTITQGQERRRDELLLHLVDMQYKRNDYDFSRATFRVRGDVLEIFPAYEEEYALRVEMFDEQIERISTIDPLTGKVLARLDTVTIYPSSHHVTPEQVRLSAMETIRSELAERLEFYEKHKRYVEEQRLRERTFHDLEMIKEIGFCKGIENYSRHFSMRAAGQPPPCLLDYFPEDFLLIVDESHQTVPQIRAMYSGDRARKESLVEYGFRLPSAYDNRPLQFMEWYNRLGQVVYVSATPAPWEIKEASGILVEQLIRPTGLLDPIIELLPAQGQVDNSLEQIRKEIARSSKVLVTTLTKRLAEELTQFLLDLNIKAKYLHSDIDTIERTEIIQQLRQGHFDVLVGINLLREGLDIPEVSLVLILDADKEGFLRSETSLIQTCGRAARHVRGRVVMYADKRTAAIDKAIETTATRRALQQRYNEEHGITPVGVQRQIVPLIESHQSVEASPTSKQGVQASYSEGEKALTLQGVRALAEKNKQLMEQAAKQMRYEDAARYRDLMRHYEQLELES